MGYSLHNNSLYILMGNYLGVFPTSRIPQPIKLPFVTLTSKAAIGCKKKNIFEYFAIFTQNKTNMDTTGYSY